MSLSRQDEKFLAKRRHLIRAWRYVGGLVAAAITAFVLYLWFHVPLLGNPVLTARRAEAGEIAETTLLLSAVMLPLIVLMLFGVLAALVAFVFRALANEHRYLSIIEGLQQRRQQRISDP